MILGVGQRLLPILGHTLLPWPRLVLPTFLLIALGNLLRVLTEMATPLSAFAFRAMPFSAVLELSALALFTANAVRTFGPTQTDSWDPRHKRGEGCRGDHRPHQ